MRRVLIITDYLPPDGVGRAEKTLSRAEHFRERGWNVTVLCTTTLFPNPIAGVRVVKARTALPSKYFSSSKLSKVFIALSVITISLDITFAQMYKKFDCVITVNNPVFFHFFGFVQSWRHDSIWLAELRDSWLEFPGRREFKYKFLHRVIEKLITNHAQKIFWHKGMRHSLTYWGELMGVSEHRLAVLPPLGTSANQHEGPSPEAEPSSFSDGVIKFGYFGRFYPGEIEPTDLISSFCRAFEPEETAAQLLFFGEDPYVFDSRLVRHPGIRFEGVLGHGDVLPRMLECDALLLLMGKSEGCEFAIPTKLFDYIATGRTVIALAPAEATATREVLLNMTGSICLHDADDLPRAFRSFLQKTPLAGGHNYVVDRQKADDMVVDLCEPK